MNIEKRPVNELESYPVFNFSVTHPVKGLFKREKTTNFEIGNICIHTMSKIAAEALKIDASFLQKDTGALDATYKIASENGSSLLKIVAYAILNANQEPDSKLLNVLGYMKARELKTAYMAIVERIDFHSFLTAMLTIGRANVIDMNPTIE